MKLCFVIVTLLFFTSIISLFQIKSHVQDVNKLLIQTQKNIDEVYKEIHILQAEWSYLNRPDRLEKIADKQRLNHRIVLARQVYTDINALQHSESMLAQK